VQEVTTISAAATEAWAAGWAAGLPLGSVVLLSADLGGGKTCFVRGLVRGLRGDPEEVNSPSFTLQQAYGVREGQLFHWDLYRLGPATDWGVLDLADHLADSGNRVAVEWPERYPGPWPEAGRVHTVRLEPVPDEPEHRRIRALPGIRV